MGYDRGDNDWMKVMDIIKNLTALFVFVGVLFSAYFYIDKTYAQKDQIAQTKQEVVDILKTFRTDLSKDRLEQNYINILSLERQYKALTTQYPNDSNLRLEYRQIIKDREFMKLKLDEMRGIK
jgi:Tfp pilus assembly protein PilO